MCLYVHFSHVCYMYFYRRCRTHHHMKRVSMARRALRTYRQARRYTSASTALPSQAIIVWVSHTLLAIYVPIERRLYWQYIIYFCFTSHALSAPYTTASRCRVIPRWSSHGTSSRPRTMRINGHDAGWWGAPIKIYHEKRRLFVSIHDDMWRKIIPDTPVDPSIVPPCQTICSMSIRTLYSIIAPCIHVWNIFLHIFVSQGIL